MEGTYNATNRHARALRCDGARCNVHQPKHGGTVTESELWTYKDVAAYLRISWRTVRRWAGEGKLPVVKIGNRNRFDPEKVRKWASKK